MGTKFLKNRIEIKIQRSRKCVFLRRDFKSLGGYDQIGRALKKLIQEGKLIKLGYGLYAKARLNRITRQPMIDADGGFEQVAKAALKRLGIEWKETEATKQYQKGRSTQIPIKIKVKTRKRFNRKISYRDSNLKTSKYHQKRRSTRDRTKSNTNRRKSLNKKSYLV